MAVSRFANAQPVAGIDTLLYTITRTSLTSIVAVNIGGFTKISAWIVPAGEDANPTAWIHYINEIDFSNRNTFETFKIAVNVGDRIYVKSLSGEVTFFINGIYDQSSSTNITVGLVAPESPQIGDLWVDESTFPSTVFYWSGTAWANISTSGTSSSLPDTVGNGGEFLSTDGTSSFWSNTVTANSASATGLIIKGFASQDSDITQIQSSTGSVLQGTTSIGQQYIATTNPLPGMGGNTTIAIGSATGTGTVATITPTNTLFTTNIQVGQWITVAGITPTGYNGTYRVTAKTSTTLSYANSTTITSTVAGLLYYGSASLSLSPLTTYSPALVVKGLASQNAPVQEWQNSTGGVLASVSASGVFTAGSSITSGGSITAGTSMSSPSGFYSTGTNASGNNNGRYYPINLFKNATPSFSTLVVNAPTSGTQDSFAITSSTGAPYFQVNQTGKIYASNPTLVPLKVIATPTTAVVISSISGSGTVVTYNTSQMANPFVVGQTVTITGATNAAYNLTDAVVTSTVFASFTVSSTATGATSTASAVASGAQGNLTEWQTNGGTAVASISASGTLTASGISTAYFYGAGNSAYIHPSISTTLPLVAQSSVPTATPWAVRGTTSQTASLQQWQDSAGVVLSSIAADGSYFAGASSASSFISALNGRAAIYAKTPTTVPLTARGAASQTGDLQQWQNSAGLVLAKVDSSGNLNISDKLRLFYSQPPTAATSTDAAYMFSTTIPSGSFTEVSGEILSYGINVSQIGTRDTARVGGIFRIDTRSAEQTFDILGTGLGAALEAKVLSVNLISGGMTATPASPINTKSSTNVGYVGTPQVSTATGLALTAAHSGKHIYTTTTGQTHTIPANGTTPLEIGTTIVFINPVSVTTSIAITTDTLILAGTGTTGTRTLSAYGMATAIKITATSWMINGSGLA